MFNWWKHFGERPDIKILNPLENNVHSMSGPLQWLCVSSELQIWSQTAQVDVHPNVKDTNIGLRIYPPTTKQNKCPVLAASSPLYISYLSLSQDDFSVLLTRSASYSMYQVFLFHWKEGSHGVILSSDFPQNLFKPIAFHGDFQVVLEFHCCLWKRNGQSMFHSPAWCSLWKQTARAGKVRNRVENIVEMKKCMLQFVCENKVLPLFSWQKKSLHLLNFILSEEVEAGEIVCDTDECRPQYATWSCCARAGEKAMVSRWIFSWQRDAVMRTASHICKAALKVTGAQLEENGKYPFSILIQWRIGNTESDYVNGFYYSS